MITAATVLAVSMLRIKPIGGASRVFSVPLRLGASQRAISTSVVTRATLDDESTNKVQLKHAGFTSGRMQDTVPEWQQGMVLPGRFRGGYSPANGNPGPSARYGGGGSPAAQQPAPKYGPRGGRGGQIPGQQSPAAPQQPPQQQQQYQQQPYQPQYQQQQHYQPYGAPGGQQMGASQGFQTSAAPRDQANYGNTDLSYLANASVEEKWAALRDNPDAFWDNRETKRNPRGPDFKLKDKDADVALWVVSNDTPEWARQQYGQGLDFSRLGAPGQGSAGPAVPFEEVQHLAAASPAERWEHWRNNPDMWWDNRESKRNPRAPDFKIKNRDVDAALWIDSKDTPPDIRQHYGLPAVSSGPPAAADVAWLANASLEEKWAHLQANPGAWWDNRESKKNPKAPDFKLKSQSGAVDAVLWLSSAGTPEWAIKQYGPGNSSPGAFPPAPTQEWAALATASAEEKWAYLKNNPQAFWDNRTTKTNPRAPDYKLKSREVDVALWVDSKDTPAWARQEFAPPTN